MSTLGDLQVGDAQLAECAVNEVIAISRKLYSVCTFVAGEPTHRNGIRWLMIPLVRWKRSQSETDLQKRQSPVAQYSVACEGRPLEGVLAGLPREN